MSNWNLPAVCLNYLSIGEDQLSPSQRYLFGLIELRRERGALRKESKHILVIRLARGDSVGVSGYNPLLGGESTFAIVDLGLAG
jgi:hypothetical protein